MKILGKDRAFTVGFALLVLLSLAALLCDPQCRPTGAFRAAWFSFDPGGGH